MVGTLFLSNWISIFNSSFFQLKDPPVGQLSFFNSTINILDSDKVLEIINLNPILAIIIGLVLLLIIGEIIFIRKIKKEKISFLNKDNVDIEIRKIKINSFLLSLLLILFTYPFVVILVLLLICIFMIIYGFIFNIGYFLCVLFEAGIVIVILALICKYGFEFIYFVNKKITKNMVKIETEEEFNKRQESYKFKEGEEVKLKSDLIIDNRYGAKRYLDYKAKNQNKVLIVKSHSKDPTLMSLQDKETRKNCRGYYTDEMLEHINNIVDKQ